MSATGDYPIRIGADELRLRYDWWALDRVHNECGEDALNRLALLPVSKIAKILEIGLQFHHKGYGADAIMNASPPVIAMIAAIDQAASAAYLGNEPAPPPSDIKKN
jgi:hypothetical protein